LADNNHPLEKAYVVYDEAIKRALEDLDKGFRGMTQFPGIDKEPKQQKPALPFNPIRRI
jgi:hypothetical protein|tara:strand:- start:342 stop:518 length:177 start_codon:yes stop_codon:yes gene_type:complete